MKGGKPDLSDIPEANPLTPQDLARGIANQRVGLTAERAGQVSGSGAPVLSPEAQRQRQAMVDQKMAPVRQVLAEEIPADAEKFANVQVRKGPGIADKPMTSEDFVLNVPGAVANFPGREPRPNLRPGADYEVYLIQKRLQSKGFNIEADGLMGPKTRAALAQEARDPSVAVDTSKPGVTTMTFAEDAEPEPPMQAGQMQAAPESQTEEPFVPGESRIMPDLPSGTMLADAPAPLRSKQDRFDALMVKSGYDKPGGDMDFLRIAAKFADTEAEVEQVMKAISLARVPPRTIGDLITGAHKDRFRKEVMGLMPKIKEKKTVSEKEKAETERLKSQTNVNKKRVEEIQGKIDKQGREAAKEAKKKGSTGSGSKTIKGYLDQVRQQKKTVQDSLKIQDDVIDQHRAEYLKLKTIRDNAARRQKDRTSRSATPRARPEEREELERKFQAADKALTDFNAKTGYEEANRKKQALANILNKYDDASRTVRQSRKVTKESWGRLSDLTRETSESLAERESKADDIRKKMGG
tara:strand:- start:661 stop:2232 length:1572 start_codon:yes stop_codon:yes gene_type:complete